MRSRGHLQPQEDPQPGHRRVRHEAGPLDGSERPLPVADGREVGYFDVPREAKLGDIADRLDVSHQALSERLRRGHANLVQETIGVGPPEKTLPAVSGEPLASNDTD